MDVPQITDDAERRKWLVAQPRREGLLTREFASVMGVNPSAIQAAIRRGKLRGVRLRALGRVYAYAATVDPVAEYYRLSEDVVSYLQGLTRVDVTGRFSWVGIPFSINQGVRKSRLSSRIKRSSTERTMMESRQPMEIPEGSMTKRKGSWESRGQVWRVLTPINVAA